MILRGTDNKILRSASGEILKQPPIIDISSDYGVTKDGSNLVSSVKNRYAPNVFRAPSGKEPIENGNGFDFSAGTDKLLKGGTGLNLDNFWTCEFWIKFNVDISTVRQRFITFGTFAGLTNYFGFLTPLNDADIEFQWYENGSQLSDTSIKGSALGLTDFYNWTHIYVQYAYGQIHFIRNGISGISKRNLNPTKGIKGINTLGGLDTNGSNRLDGSLNSIKFSYQYNEKYQPWNGSSVFVTDEQIFTPPTYPNTIL